MPVVAGLSCRCPRCGEGRLFSGYLAPKPICEACGLDLTFADAGDGPAVFVILIAGAIVCALALYVEVHYEPPYWVHAVIFLPLILATTLSLLRPMKGLAIALQFANEAREGRLDKSDPRT